MSISSKTWRIIKIVIRFILVISIIIFIITFFKKDKLPDKKEILDSLYKSPKQTETKATPFEIKTEGIVYSVTPLYDYEFQGLVVSYHNSDAWFDYYHQQWNDSINIKDICAIWGTNIDNDVYKKMKFENGSFHCYWQTKDSIAWSKWNSSFISNNHLVFKDKKVYNAVREVEVGDQIYFKGYLVKYINNSTQGVRNSSITRDDKGNGACETVYVEDFQILKKNQPKWRLIFSISKNLIVGCLVLLFVLVFVD